MSAVSEFRWTHRDLSEELHPWFEHAPVGLAQCRRPGYITAVNPALEQMLGGRANLGRSLADLIHLRDRAQSERLLRELFDAERDSFQVDSLPIATGTRLRWTAWRVAGANGESDHIVAMVAEVPEDAHEDDAQKNREAEQRLHQAERLEAVGRLAGGVAHDFNNLLTGVMLYCDLLMAHLEPCHRVRKYAEEIRKAGMQATGLVRQLLAVSRPTTSEPRLLSLNEIAEGMRNLLVRLIGENIELSLRLDPNLGLVKMDPTQAQQILLNLVLNARDAMPGGGQISIETHNCKVQVLAEPVIDNGRAAVLPCALFIVADNGGGMDAATRDHVFEAFFTTKTGGKGTGLGLATVYDIVTRNGGLIHLDSTPACGTRVTVLLPLIPETALSSQAEHNFESNPDTLISTKKE